ncbi:MAG: hypothetical protein AAFR62_13650 [Cyanobacteria bacterium J06629_2]
MPEKIFQITFALVTTIIAISGVQAQVQPIAINRNLVREDPKAYCTPLQGQAVYDGAIVTVPAGHDCSSWLNYLLQQEITEKNIELKREENETNAKLQLYLNTTPRW